MLFSSARPLISSAFLKSGLELPSELLTKTVGRKDDQNTRQVVFSSTLVVPGKRTIRCFESGWSASYYRRRFFAVEFLFAGFRMVTSAAMRELTATMGGFVT